METILTASAFILGFSLVIISVPPLIRIAKTKNLFEPFDERKVHTQVVPPLGGVAIFIGFILSTIVSTDGLSFDSLKYIIASVIMMFFIGLKDDLLVISARKKIIVQVFAAVLLITLGDVQITNLHGMFGIYQINYFVGVILTLFIMLSLINAYNLIDGIDGLASGLTIFATSVFGAWLFLAGHIQFAIMSFALMGSLSGFFIYNVFGKKNKLFMGDTGSLIIGLVLSTLVIEFNEFNIIKSAPHAVKAAPVVSFSIVIVPLIDTLRVITIRLLQGKSPFYPDKNHTHHRLLSLIPGHLNVTLIMIAANITIVGVAMGLNNVMTSVSLQFLLIFLLGAVLSFIPSVLLRVKNAEKKTFSSVVKSYSNLYSRAQ